MTLDRLTPSTTYATSRFEEDHDSLLAALIENSDDAILSLTPEGKIMTFNRAAEQMFDYSREEIVGLSAFQLVPLGRGGDLQEKHKRIRNGESVEHYETVRLKKDGTRFNVSLRISPIRDGGGKLKGISWIVRDITAQKAAEALIRKLSSVVEQTADTVMITDKSGAIEYVNPAFEATTGFREEEALGRSSNILKSGKHPSSFYKKLWDTILAGRPFQATMINKKKNGELFYTEKTISPLMEASGTITHFVSTDKDVTDRKLAEQHAQAVQRRFTELFNYSHDPMAYCALDGTVIESNTAFSTLTGYADTELLHRRKFQDMNSSRFRECAEKIRQRMLVSPEPCVYETEYLRKDERQVPALVTVFPVRDGAGEKIVGIGIVVKDITVLKKQQKQLEGISEELRRSNTELEQFASIASHDMQEPLRTISTYLQLIELKNRDKLDDDSKQFLSFAVEASRRLHALIGDLLAYSKVGSQRVALVPFESGEAVNGALCNLEKAITESHAAIEVERLPRIVGDPQTMVQLFQNLIGNAIKYRSEMPPVVKVSAQRAPGGWTFKVSDNGIGIPSKSTTSVFEMFRRVHGKNEYPGTGIGLAICKKIVELRGGRIWVESHLGKGSDFLFTVPEELPRA